MLVQIGVVTLSLSCMDFDEVLEFVADSGGETIELCTVDEAHNGTLNLNSNRDAILKAVEERGLSVISVAGYNDFGFSDESILEKEVKRLEWYCELARDLGVGVIRSMGGNLHTGNTREEAIDNVVRGFRLAVQMAEKYDVILALENHGYLVNDGPALWNIINEVDSPRLRLTLDTGNFCWAGHSVDDAHSYFGQLAPYTANVHLKDLVYTESNEVQFVPLGEGVIDFHHLMEVLTANGYNGSLLSEFEGMGDPKILLETGSFSRDEFMIGLKSGTEKSLKYMQRLID